MTAAPPTAFDPLMAKLFWMVMSMRPVYAGPGAAFVTGLECPIDNAETPPANVASIVRLPPQVMEMFPFSTAGEINVAAPWPITAYPLLLGFVFLSNIFPDALMVILAATVVETLEPVTSILPCPIWAPEKVPEPP